MSDRGPNIGGTRLFAATIALVLFLDSGALQAWQSGKEDSPGPAQARMVLPPWNAVIEPETDSDKRNEHGWLMLTAFRSAGVPEELINSTQSLSVYSHGLVIDTSMFVGSSMLPEPFDSASVLRNREFNISGFAGLADHSFSLWDWASGNESCPMGTTPENLSSDVVACHTFTTHLGAVNSNHFIPQSANTYRWYHELAVVAAKECKTIKDALFFGVVEPATAEFMDSFYEQCRVFALSLEAFGQHFLQDTWAVGHMWQRWGAPDLRQFPEPNGQKRAQLIAAFAGLIHGCESICGFDDAMSGGTESAYLDSIFGPIPLDGTGDLHVDNLIDDQKQFILQKNQLLQCSVAGVLDVWRALGENARDSLVDSTSSLCLDPGNTNSAIYAGLGYADARIFEDNKIPEWIIKTALGSWFTIDDALEEEFRKDILRFEEIMNLMRRSPEQFSRPNYVNAFTPILGVTVNGTEQPDLPILVKNTKTLTPPARFSDPSTMDTSILTGVLNPEHIEIDQNDPLIGETVNSVDVLKRLFNKAHLKTLCSDDETDPIALKSRVSELRANGDEAQPVVCEICTEFAARHLQFPQGSQSMCQLVGGGGTPITDFTPTNTPLISELLDISPLESAAAEWCGCSFAIVDIPFDDLALESCVESYSADREWVVATDVTWLSCTDLGISSLTGLEYLTNLEGLDLFRNNNIQDLQPISGLSKLHWLEIWQNQVTSLEPLRGLKELGLLEANNNDIDSLEPLKGHKKLWWLTVADNPRITDISPIQDYENLRIFNIANNPIQDISVLSNPNLASMTNLSLDFTDIDNNDFQAISGMTNMLALGITGTGIADLSPLSGMIQVERLHLASNNIEPMGLIPLQGLPALKYLVLSENKIWDVTNLTDMTQLIDLHLLNQDYPPGLSCEQRQIIKAALPSTNVFVEDLWNDPDDNPDLGDIDCFADPEPFRLTISVVGEGRVYILPLGIDCLDVSCSVEFAPGTVVSLWPHSTDSVWKRFESWSGACSGNENNCGLTMDSSKSVTATFGDIYDIGPERIIDIEGFEEGGVVGNTYSDLGLSIDWWAIRGGRVYTLPPEQDFGQPGTQALSIGHGTLANGAETIIQFEGGSGAEFSILVGLGGPGEKVVTVTYFKGYPWPIGPSVEYRTNHSLVISETAANLGHPIRYVQLISHGEAGAFADDIRFKLATRKP